MNDIQIYPKKYSKLSLHKNDNTKLKKNMQLGLKNMFITNSNGLEISSQYGNYYQNSKKNILEENYNFRHITNNNSNNKNFSFPLQTTSSNKNININIKHKDGSLVNQKNNLFKKKFEKYLNNSKKDDSSNNYNSKENTNNNINNNINKNNNMKINIIPKKSNFKFINLRENNMSLNNNKYIGKSISKSKSKSKSKNKRDNKNYNNKFNNDINKIIFDKYLRLYKIGEKGLGKKAKSKHSNYLNKESSNYNINKYSNDINNSDIHKMSSLNMAVNMQYKGLRKKNKSSNLLISNINKPRNNNNNISKTNSNIMITKIESNNNTNKNGKNKNNKSNKKYLTENHIMYIMNKKKSGMKKKNNKKNKEKQISSKDIKNNSNSHTNTNTNNTNSNNNHINNNNNNSNNLLSNYIMNKKINQEKIIYDYKSNNNLLYKQHQKSNNNNNNNNYDDNINDNINDIINDNINDNIIENSKKNLINNFNDNNNNSDNLYKLNERLKTEYNENSMEAIDNLYEEENIEEVNKKSLSFSKHGESFRFLYPEIYIKDDECDYDSNNNKKEKELDETESPLKMDTDKVSIENSGVLSFDQVKDIICYYNMNNTDIQSDFLFQKNERKIFELNYKNKYFCYFFGNTKNIVGDKNINNDNNDLNDDIITFNTNIKNKNQSNSIFSLETEYSSKMNKKYNKIL